MIMLMVHALLYFVLVLIDFTHIIQDYFYGTLIPLLLSPFE